MAGVISADKVELDVVSSGAKPAVQVLSTAVVCHLTKGYAAQGDTETIDPAVTINGKVPVSGNEADWKGWKFGFLQLHQINSMEFWYAGKARSDGGIGIVVHKAPAMTQTLCLDSEKAFSPWTRGDDHYWMEGKMRHFSTDHPACRAKRDLPNGVTGRTNFLFHIVDKRELWTVFTVLKPDKKFQHLAHVHWTLEYNFQFNWRKGSPSVSKSSSSITFDKWEKGAPTNSALKSMLDAPGPPLANDLTRASMTAAVIGGPPNRMEVAQRYIVVPSDFYTD